MHEMRENRGNDETLWMRETYGARRTRETTWALHRFEKYCQKYLKNETMEPIQQALLWLQELLSLAPSFQDYVMFHGD